MTIKELERQLNIRTAEDMEKEFQRINKRNKKSIYKSMKAELQMFLEYKKAPLKDKLIAANYFLLFRQARKTYKKNKSKEQYPAWDYLANEEVIAAKLFYEVNQAKNQKAIKKVTNVMKMESEVLKRKTAEMKQDKWNYETDDEMRQRLADYAKKEYIEDHISYRKREEEYKIREKELAKKVEESKAALDAEIDKIIEEGRRK